jgi:hypothetical protein
LAAHLILEGESAVCGVEHDTVTQDFIVRNGGLQGADVGHYHSVVGLPNHPAEALSKKNKDEERRVAAIDTCSK